MNDKLTLTYGARTLLLSEPDVPVKLDPREQLIEEAGAYSRRLYEVLQTLPTDEERKKRREARLAYLNRQIASRENRG